MEDCKLVVFAIRVRWCHLNKSAFHGAGSPYRDGHYDLNATKGWNFAPLVYKPDDAI